MTMTTITGSFGRPATGAPGYAFAEAGAWRVRQIHGAKTAPSQPLVTDVPVNKPPHVSASERCP